MPAKVHPLDLPEPTLNPEPWSIDVPVFFPCSACPVALCILGCLLGGSLGVYCPLGSAGLFGLVVFSRLLY